MCGRYTLHSDPGTLALVAAVESCPAIAPRFNIAPGTDVLALGRHTSGARLLRMLRWGLEPGTGAGGHRRINVRLETAVARPGSRELLERRRCLLLADGFYEWRVAPDGRDPFYVRWTGGGVVGFAALWDRDPAAGQRSQPTCAILTKPADGGLERLHDRMPAIVDRADWQEWLDPQMTSRARAEQLARRIGGDRLEWWPVSRRVNNVRNDGPELIAPIA